MRAQTMYDRLSSITQRIPGLKLTQMPTSGGYFISTDMFYIEVLMDSSRTKVVEVKVAHNSEPSPCPVLTQVLFNNDLETFARHLEGLASIYQLSTDKKQKSRAYMALTALETDLSRLANLQSTSINSCINILHKSPVGVMEPRKGGLPVRLTYFISPYDLVDVSRKELINLTISNIMDKNLGLSVTIGIEGSNTTHVLQTTTLISIRETPEGKSLPSSAPHTAQNSASLPAHFVMNLSKPMPISIGIIKKIDQIVKIQEFSANLIKHPLLNLIARQQLETPTSAPDEGLDFRRSVFCAKILNQHQIYHVSGIQLDNFSGAIVKKIPFTHPTNIPSILKLLRQQALFNFMIGSCIRDWRPFDPSLVLVERPNRDIQILDINPLSLTSICVTFEHPSKESLATLEIDLRDINDMRCQLHALNMDTVCSNEYASKVLQKCWSIPITIKSVMKKCFEKTAHVQEETVRKREREMEELLKNNSQQVYQNQLPQSGRESSNPYFFDGVHGEILTDNLLFPHHQSSSTNHQNSSLSTENSGSPFLLSDPVLRSNMNSLGSEASNMTRSQYLKRFVCHPRTKADTQPSINNLRQSDSPQIKSNSQSQTSIKLECNVQVKKASVCKQSNTMLMSMLSDIPAANTQSQIIPSNRPALQNPGGNQQRSVNIQRPLQTQSIINKQNPPLGQFSSVGSVHQKQSTDSESGVVEKQKRSRKRKGGMEAEGGNQGFGPRSPKTRKGSDEPLNNVIAIENNVSAVAKPVLPNIILPGSRMDIKLKNDQSGQNNPTISYISTQQSSPSSKFAPTQDITGSMANSNVQRRDNLETDSIKKERKRKRAESTDNSKSASNTAPPLSVGGQTAGGNNIKGSQSGGTPNTNQVKLNSAANSGNLAKPRKGSIGAVIDRLVGAVNQGPSTANEGQTTSSSSASAADSSKSNTDQTSSGSTGANRSDSSTKVGPSTSSAKTPKYSRGSDQFAIKQGSTGLKLTVTKTKPATPPSASVPEAVSKILNLGTTSNIKYTIPKLSKTQQAAQSAASTPGQAAPSDQGPSQTSSSDNNNTTAATSGTTANTATTVTSILASAPTSSSSSASVGAVARKNPPMSFRGAGPGSLVRGPISSSNHPPNKSILSSQPNAIMNRPSSAMQSDSMNLQRVSASSNIGHPQQMLMQPTNRQNPRFSVPQLGQNRFVSTIITPNAAPQFPQISSNLLGPQSEMTTGYAATQSTINVRPVNNNKFMSSSGTDASNISSPRSHINNIQSTNLAGTSSMVSYAPRQGIDPAQASSIPRPSSAGSAVTGPGQFYARQSTFDEALQNPQTMSLGDNNNAPTMVATTITPHSESDSSAKSNIPTFSLLPRPIARVPGGVNNVEQNEQSSHEDNSSRNPKPPSPAFDDNKMIESPERPTGTTSSSEVSKPAISSTPSSPADCNQEVEVLPPPPLIPIDSLDDDQPPRDSIASSDNDASDRLSIADINEAMADSISSAGTPKPYPISEMTSPASTEVVNHPQQQQSVPIVANDPPGGVISAQEVIQIKSPGVDSIKESLEQPVGDSAADVPEIEPSNDRQDSCVSGEAQKEKSPEAVAATNHPVSDRPQAETPDEMRNIDDAKPSQIDDTSESSKILGSKEPLSSALEFQTQNKTLNALRGISSYNADSEGTSSSTEGTPTNKSPNQELDSDYKIIPSIINTDQAHPPMDVDTFPKTASSDVPAPGSNQVDNAYPVDEASDSRHQSEERSSKDPLEVQETSREPDHLSVSEPVVLDQPDNNGTIDGKSSANNDENQESRRLSTNESDANVISAQSPSSV